MYHIYVWIKRKVLSDNVFFLRIYSWNIEGLWKVIIITLMWGAFKSKKGQINSYSSILQ